MRRGGAIRARGRPWRDGRPGRRRRPADARRHERVRRSGMGTRGKTSTKRSSSASPRRRRARRREMRTRACSPSQTSGRTRAGPVKPRSEGSTTPLTRGTECSHRPSIILCCRDQYSEGDLRYFSPDEWFALVVVHDHIFLLRGMKSDKTAMIHSLGLVELIAIETSLSSAPRTPRFPEAALRRYPLRIPSLARPRPESL